ncbi:MAG: DUF7544 domain-containing protein, partial [Planctomycetota bacterium]
PFDLGKWFVIGFCAWLALLGQGGGGGGGNFQPPRGHGPCGSIEAMKNFVLANLFWIIPTVIFVLTVAILIGLLIVWLSSRGRFMFLHCVALNRGEVKVPWSKYRREGNSLFVFRVVVGLIYIAAVIILIALLVAFFIVISSPRSSLSGIGVALILSIFLPIFFVMVIAFALISKFTKDFVVPIMYLRTSSCVEAWREFLGILANNKGRFLLYILFQIVIALAVVAIVFAAAMVTCCCACCILVIPYIGTVLFLPVLIFKRAYSLFYFRQYGSQFDVFVPEAAAV